jgi:hypothetical protein
MSTKIVNKENAALHGLGKINEAMYGLGYLKVVEIEVNDMSAVANNDVVYTFPDDVVLLRTLVKNIGTTAFVIATNCYLDDSSNHQTGDIATLAANTSAYTYVEPTRKTAGSQILWDLGGSNTSAATAKARIILYFLTFEHVNI